jgi:hypothetical protein
MTIIKIGSIGAFTGNLGSGNVSGDIGATDISVTQIRDALTQIKQHADELEAAGADRVMLEQRIADLQAEMAKVSPDHSLVRGFLTEICWFGPLAIWLHLARFRFSIQCSGPAFQSLERVVSPNRVAAERSEEWPMALRSSAVTRGVNARGRILTIV